MTEKKVLIVHATAGSGHTKAAQAVYKAFGKINHNLDVKIINSLDYASAFFRWTYPRIYVFMVNRIPLIWGFFYYMLDNRFFYPLVSWMRHLTNWMHNQRLVKFLEEYQPDLVIATHFVAPDLITMAGKRRIGGHLISVVTDYRSHTFWIVKGVDTYVTAYDVTKNDLIERGVSPDKIKVLGVPVDPLFSEKIDKDELRKKIGIKENRFTVLVGSGGFGIGPVEGLVKELIGIDIPIQLLVVCGKNESLFSTIKKLEKDVTFPMRTFSFVDNMDELMTLSDIIVTKSGGIVSAEALAKGLPIVAIFPIPGQEARNASVLLQKGLAYRLKNPGDIKGILTQFYRDRDGIDRMKKRISSMTRPDAAIDIAKLAVDILR